MASLATHGKARTKAALQRFSHEGGHAFAEPPSKVVGENKKFRRESMKALAEGANHISTGASIVMKKARKSIVNIKNTIMKKKETLPVVQSELCSLVRDIEIDSGTDMVLHGIARVFLMDSQSYIDISFDRNSLVGEFNEVIAKHLNLTHDGVCGVVQYCFGNYLPLEDTDHIIEIMGSWESEAEAAGTCRLCYIQEYYLPGGPFDTSSLDAANEDKEEGLTAHKIRYLECCHRLRTGMYSLSVKRAVKVAAMQILAKRFQDELYYPSMEEIISPAITERFGVRDVENDVKAELTALGEVYNDAISYEHHVLEIVSNAIPYYGSSFFPVKVMIQDVEQQSARSTPEEKICAVGNDGIHLLSGWNLSVDEYFAYSNIHRWTTAADPDLFAFVDDDNIHFLIYEYPKAIQKRVTKSIEGLMKFHNGEDDFKSTRNYNSVIAAKTKFLAMDNMAFSECAKVKVEGANLKTLYGDSGHNLVGKNAELIDIKRNRSQRRTSLAMTQLVSAGVAVDNATSEQLKSVAFKGFGTDGETQMSKKERRMSAIRALNAKKQAAKLKQSTPE
eukprot:g8361.t1